MAAVCVTPSPPFAGGALPRPVQETAQVPFVHAHWRRLTRNRRLATPLAIATSVDGGSSSGAVSLCYMLHKQCMPMWQCCFGVSSDGCSAAMPESCSMRIGMGMARATGTELHARMRRRSTRAPASTRADVTLARLVQRWRQFLVQGGMCMYIYFQADLKSG